LPTIVISAVEILFVFSTFYLFHARSADAVGHERQNLYYSIGFAASIFIMMVALGLYNRAIFGKHREMLMRIVLSFCFVLPIFIAAVEFIGRYSPSAVPPSPESYLPGMLLGLISVIGTRFLILPMVDVGALKKRVLIIGIGELAHRIEGLVAENANRGFLVVDFVRFGAEAPRIASRYIDEKKVQEGDSLANIADEKLVDEIVIATRDRRGLPIDDLLDCKLKGITITEYLTFWERETGQIDLEALQPSWLFFSDGFRMNWFPNLIKRMFDVVVSLI
jgi:hypothetical protein